MLVNNRQNRPVTFSGSTGLIVLSPGWNEMSDKDAETLRVNSKPLKLEENGHLEFGPTAKAKEGGKEAGKTLSELTPVEAEETIKETNDIKLLEKWRKGEKRDDVRLLIANRIEEVKNYKPGESDQEGPEV